MAKILRREWTSACVRAPTPYVVDQETRTAGTGRSYRGSPETSHGSVARLGCSCTNTPAKEPRIPSARQSWRSVFPSHERTTLPRADEREGGLTMIAAIYARKSTEQNGISNDYQPVVVVMKPFPGFRPP
jgi:hypothetical protein